SIRYRWLALHCDSVSGIEIDGRRGVCEEGTGNRALRADLAGRSGLRKFDFLSSPGHRTFRFGFPVTPKEWASVEPNSRRTPAKNGRVRGRLSPARRYGSPNRRCGQWETPPSFCAKVRRSQLSAATRC